MIILFLEDRPDRQKLFLPYKDLDFVELNSIDMLEMPEVNQCRTILHQINQAEFKIESTVKLIIVHRSALNSNGISYLNKLCKSSGIKVIYFSGNISQTTYFADGFEQININSSDFYSELLIPFLKQFIKDEKTSILEVFNKNWKLSYMFLYKQLKINFELEKDDDGPYSPKIILENKMKICEEILGKDTIVNLDMNIEKLILKS
jgi:hypothetical protein